MLDHGVRERMKLDPLTLSRPARMSFRQRIRLGGENSRIKLHNVVTRSSEYYHTSRTHMGLNDDAPFPRKAERSERGAVIAIPQVGGLHHRYTRRAA